MANDPSIETRILRLVSPLNDAEMVRVQNEHQFSFESSEGASERRNSRPNRKISPNSGSSLNEPAIWANQFPFLANESTDWRISAISFSNRVTRSSTVTSAGMKSTFPDKMRRRNLCIGHHIAERADAKRQAKC